MNATSISLARAPEARAETVDDLVANAREGRLRVPVFQRGLKWRTDDVCELFDSIYRGLPIGSLLLWKRQAPAGPVQLGPIHIDAPEMTDAWFVVDGQQRVTSLVASLAREWPPPSDATDPFRLLFDAAEGKFVPFDPQSPGPSTAVPLPKLLDAVVLGDWVQEWQHKDLRHKVFEAGKRLREYRVPIALVSTEDEAVLREIFRRVNNSGRKLEWPEVHDALFGNKGQHPGTLADLAATLEPTGFGRIDETQLMTCLLAIKGEDVTRSLGELLREDPEVLSGAVGLAFPVMERVISFLRSEARIAHIRLLPRGWILEPLARFFHLHPRPVRRNVELLVRWTWRVLVAAEHREDRSLRRKVIDEVGEDETASIQALLALIPRQMHLIAWPERFDARAAESRVMLLGLGSLSPRSLADGSVLDVGATVAAADAEAFVRLIAVAPDGPANRAIHPPVAGGLRRWLEERARAPKHDPVLSSHAIGAQAAAALLDGAWEVFLAERRARIAEALARHAEKMCGWDRKDRDRPALRRGGG